MAYVAAQPRAPDHEEPWKQDQHAPDLEEAGGAIPIAHHAHAPGCLCFACAGLRGEQQATPASGAQQTPSGARPHRRYGHDGAQTLYS